MLWPPLLLLLNASATGAQRERGKNVDFENVGMRKMHTKRCRHWRCCRNVLCYLSTVGAWNAYQISHYSSLSCHVQRLSFLYFIFFLVSHSFCFFFPFFFCCHWMHLCERNARAFCWRMKRMWTLNATHFALQWNAIACTRSWLGLSVVTFLLLCRRWQRSERFIFCCTIWSHFLCFLPLLLRLRVRRFHSSLVSRVATHKMRFATIVATNEITNLLAPVSTSKRDFSRI